MLVEVEINGENTDALCETVASFMTAEFGAKSSTRAEQRARAFRSGSGSPTLDVVIVACTILQGTAAAAWLADRAGLTARITSLCGKLRALARGEEGIGHLAGRARGAN